MSGHQHNESLPKPALIGAGFCIAVTLAITGSVALGILPKPVTMKQERSAAKVEMVSQIDLQFLDQTDGSVLIRDASKGAVASTLTPGSNSGFIRGVMRGMARDRHLRGLESDAPFRLTLWANQNLALEDLATGRTIELNGFGDTNRAAFLSLMAPQAKAATVAAR
jgi:putative photosynthetic complex assembly protein